MAAGGDDQTPKDPVDKAIGQAAIAALFVLVTVVFFYFVAFRGEGCCDQQAWGQFGDFLGGTVNPVLGFLSLVVLARTLIEQRRLFGETRAQAERGELQRLMATTCDTLDRQLAELETNQDRTGHLFNAQSAQSKWGGRIADRRGVPESVAQAIRYWWQDIRDTKHDIGDVKRVAKDHRVAAIRLTLVRLAWCVRAFGKAGGAESIRHYYGKTYKDAIRLAYSFRALGLIADEASTISRDDVVLFGLAAEAERIDALAKAEDSEPA